MKKTINFYYAILIITIIAGGTAFWLIQYSYNYFNDTLIFSSKAIGNNLQTNVSDPLSTSSELKFVDFNQIKAILLEKKTSVPILLPSKLSDNFIDNKSSEDLYAFVSTNSSGYEVRLGYGPGCDYNACFAGYFSAVLNDEKGMVGIEEINLNNDIKGYYKPVTCGGSCSPASIDWIYQNVHYNIQFDVADKESLMIMANSAIISVANVVSQ